MVRMHAERFPSEILKNLHARYMGPYGILRRFNSNAYELDIPRDLGINLGVH